MTLSGDEDLDREFELRREWQRRLAEGDWAGVHWPREYGGRDASYVESAIFFEELAHHRCPLPANVLGLLLAGPTIMACGTREQKDRFLPPILPADEIWCQGFSEPEAGSDLAAVKTRAERDGDGWVIRGQKVWTSYARHAKRCMLLARTDPDAPKHQGLTYFLMDMEQDGVDVLPLREITGSAHFNELFIEGARVTDDEVLGGVGGGWKTAMATLTNERSGLASFHHVRMRQSFDALLEESKANGRIEDPRVRESLGRLSSRIEVLRLTSFRGLSKLARDGSPGPEGSLTKLMWSATNQALTQSAIEILGPEALYADRRWSYELLRSKGNSIEGGTTEILKNIVAERVLGLPRSR